MTRVRRIDERKDSTYLIISSTGLVRSTGVRTLGQQKVAIDSPDPNWLTTFSKGLPVIHPFSIYTEKWVDTSPTQTLAAVKYQNGTDYWSAHTYSGPYYTPICLGVTEPAYILTDVGNAIDNCINECVSKINSSTAQALVTIAEAQKTLKMLRHPFKEAVSLLDKMTAHAKRSRASFSDYRSALQNSWLEYRMGWKPLMYDIQNILEAYEKLKTGFPSLPLLSERKTQKVSWRKEFDASRDGVPYFPNFKADGVYNVDYKVGCKIYFRPTVQYNTTNHHLHNFGLSVKDVPAAVWELVPYSFVVDRFVNVGAYLQAQVASEFIEILGSYKFTRKTMLQDFNVFGAQLNIGPGPLNDPPLTPRPLKGGYVSYSLDSYTRELLSTLPGLTLNPRPLTLAQHTDHLALIGQKLSVFH